MTQVVNDLVNGAGMTFWPRLAGETGAAAGRAHPRELRGPGDLRLAAAARGDARPTTTSSTPRCRPGCGWRCAPWSSGPPAGWSANRRPPLDQPGTVEQLRRAGAGDDGAAAGADDRARAGGLRAAPGPAGRTAGCPRTWPRGSRCCRRRTCCSASSRSPSARGWTPPRWRGCTSRWASGSACRCSCSASWRLPREDRWQTMARAALRDDLHAVHAQLTRRCCATTAAEESAAARIAAWEDADAVVVARAAGTLERDLLRRGGRPGPDLGRAARGAGAAGRRLSRGRPPGRDGPGAAKPVRRVSAPRPRIVDDVNDSWHSRTCQRHRPARPRPDTPPPAGVHSLWRLRGYLRPHRGVAG